jgi:hypothetical protein
MPPLFVGKHAQERSADFTCKRSVGGNSSVHRLLKGIQ